MLTGMYPLLTWGQWVVSPGFGGAVAVLVIIGARISATVQRRNARADHDGAWHRWGHP